MFSQSRQGGGRDEGGKVEEEWRREEGIWVDWHRGKLKLTSGNEQPYTSFLLLPQKTFCVCHARLSSPPADERSDMWRQTYNQVYKFPVVQWDVLTGNARIMMLRERRQIIQIHWEYWHPLKQIRHWFYYQLLLIRSLETLKFAAC